jgi:fructuronate reductase
MVLSAIISFLALLASTETKDIEMAEFDRPGAHRDRALRAPVSTRPRLGLATLARCPPEAQPAVDPRDLKVRMVHLGLGAFHRAHQAVFTEQAVAASGGDWGICGVAPRRRAVIERLGPQDGLYAVLERGPREDRVRVVATVREALAARDAPDRVLARIANPATLVVTLTVTEDGYPRDPATGRLRDDPELAADLAGDGSPRTVLGLLVRGLQARMATGEAGPITVVSCDNLPRNGAILAALVDDFCTRLGGPGGERLGDWVQAHVAFPCTVVDRIVPASTETDRADVAQALGVADHAAVVGEPFASWIIEDAFAAERPAWERAGALVVDDVAPHEALKLRVLNATHSLLAYAGLLAGLRTVDETVDADWLAEAARRFIGDVRPTLPASLDVDVDAYVEALFARWANARIGHRLEQIAR